MQSDLFAKICNNSYTPAICIRDINLSRILIFNSQNRRGKGAIQFPVTRVMSQTVISRCRYVGVQISRIYTGVRGASHKKDIMEPVVR